MLLIEADGKALFRDYGLAVPEGVLVTRRGGFDAAMPGPLIVKAQIPAGGRGKAGGVLRCADGGATARAVDRLLEGRTGIIIAHRLATVERADTILILEDGRVVEHGPRAELAADPASRFFRMLRAGLEEVLV